MAEFVHPTKSWMNQTTFPYPIRRSVAFGVLPGHQSMTVNLLEEFAPRAMQVRYPPNSENRMAIIGTRTRSIPRPSTIGCQTAKSARRAKQVPYLSMPDCRMATLETQTIRLPHQSRIACQRDLFAVLVSEKRNL